MDEISKELKGLDYNYRDLIFNVAEKYNSLFLDKELTYKYRDKNNFKQELLITCTPSNLMHLCGISGYRESSTDLKKNASRFFYDALDKKLIMDNICYRDQLLVSTKIHALMEMEQLLKKGVGVCGDGTFEMLSFNNAIRTRQIILAITYVTNENGIKLPNSAIDLRASKSNTKVFESSYRVNSITTRDLKTNEVSTVKFDHIPAKKKNKKKSKRKLG